MPSNLLSAFVNCIFAARMPLLTFSHLSFSWIVIVGTRLSLGLISSLSAAGVALVDAWVEGPGLVLSTKGTWLFEVAFFLLLSFFLLALLLANCAATVWPVGVPVVGVGLHVFCLEH